MPRTLTGVLYRVGLHHEDGASSLVSLGVRPSRMIVGELAASAADAVANKAGHRPTDLKRRPSNSRGYRPGPRRS